MNKKEKVLLILILIEIAVGFIVIDINFNKIINNYNKLNERVKKLEIDYRLYEYDLDSLQEYNY